MKNKHLTHYDRDSALLSRVVRVIAGIPKEALKLGVTVIVNNDGTKQEYKRKRQQ